MVGHNFHQPLRWPGHYFDNETGLPYNRFRYYCPSLGRYIQSNPSGPLGGTHLYNYSDTPLNQVSLLGLNPSSRYLVELKKRQLDTYPIQEKPVIDFDDIELWRQRCEKSPEQISVEQDKKEAYALLQKCMQTAQNDPEKMDVLERLNFGWKKAEWLEKNSNNNESVASIYQSIILKCSELEKELS